MTEAAVEPAPATFLDAVYESGPLPDDGRTAVLDQLRSIGVPTYDPFAGCAESELTEGHSCHA